MIVIPAIDLKEGKCVRLEQGLMERDTVFCDNPAEQAMEWERQGAELLHIVDLDGAFAGAPKNRGAIEAIVKALTIPTQLGGGIRDIPTIEAYLSLGIGRAILGTAAQRNPALVEEACRLFPGRVVVGIDAKDGMVAVQGWAEVTGVTAIELARKFEGFGVAAIIYTDISRDGMMQGPNIEATKALAEASGATLPNDSIVKKKSSSKVGTRPVIGLRSSAAMNFFLGCMRLPVPYPVQI